MNLIESQINLELTTVPRTTKDPVSLFAESASIVGAVKVIKVPFMGRHNFDKQCVTQRTITIDEFHHPHTAERIIEK